jgi:hypothetical protein
VRDALKSQNALHKLDRPIGSHTMEQCRLLMEPFEGYSLEEGIPFKTNEINDKATSM